MGSTRTKERPYRKVQDEPVGSDGVLRVGMPRAPRLQAPGGTIHVVARCNNGRFLLEEAADFQSVLRCLSLMSASYQVTLYAYTLMSNHIHLLVQAPQTMPLGRPLRWFLTQSAKAYNKAHAGRGHFWEHRYRAVLVEDDPYVLAALRYLDRNPVRAGIVEDPTAYPWSSCAAYSLGTENPLVTYHPTYLGLGDSSEARSRKYRDLVTTVTDLELEGRDPRWTESRAVGSSDFLARFAQRRARSRPRRAASG